MEAVMTMPTGRPLTVDDLDTTPDDGYRYELIDGLLIVSPPPVDAHQGISLKLTLLLHPLLPHDMKLRYAPFGVRLSEDTQIEPDLLIALRSDFSAKNLPKAPLLAIEILSPSTRRHDLMVKHSLLEAAGCASYWVVDPDEPRLIAWELRDGKYVEVANVAGDDTWHATLPFPVTITPSALLD